MGNLNKTKKRDIKQEENSTKQLLTESRKFFTGSYTAFQFIPEAIEYNSIQIKEPSLLNSALDSQDIINYVLNIYTELLPHQNQTNTTIYTPFSILKIHNDNNPSDFLTNQIQYINSFVEKETAIVLKKSALTLPLPLPLGNIINDKQLDEIEHHVSSIKTNEEEQDDNNSSTNRKGNENSQVLSETKKHNIKQSTSDPQGRRGIANNNIAINANKINNNLMTLKPDDQVTITSLLKQMSIKKSNNLLPKTLNINVQMKQMSPDEYNRLDTQEQHLNKSANYYNHDNHLIASINPDGDNTTERPSPQIKKNNTIQINGHYNGMIQKNLNKNLLTSTTNRGGDIEGTIGNNKSTCTSHRNNKENHLDNNYKICITEPTKSNVLAKINTYHQNNRNINKVNQSHLCKRYFKLKREIEEEEIVRKYYSNNQKKSKLKVDTNGHYQITIDLRKIEDNNEDSSNDDINNEGEYNLNTFNRDTKQSSIVPSPALNKLITFSPNEEGHFNNMNLEIPNKIISNKKRGNCKQIEIEIEKKLSSTRSNMPLTGIPSKERIMQLNQMEKKFFIKEDESLINNNIKHNQSINSYPKSRIRQELNTNNRLYVNIDQDIHQKNFQSKKITNELFHEYISNLNLPTYQIDYKPLSTENIENKTLNVTKALSQFKEKNKFLFEYTEEEKIIEKKMNQFNI